MKNDMFKIVTEQLLNAVRESKTLPWQKPWNTFGVRNMATGREYRGINVLLLSWFAGGELDFLTYNQASEHGAQVRKGEKSNLVVFWKPIAEKDAQGNDTKRIKTWLLRYYRVFGKAQCDVMDEGKWAKLVTKRERGLREHGKVESAERLVASIAGRIEQTTGGNRAYYSPSVHTINLPAKGQFVSLEAYYSTLAHEIGHALAKENGEEISMETESYSKEELVAEMFANYFCSYCGISNPVDNSVAYFKAWLERLEGNPQWLVSAANKAQKRFEILLKWAGLEQSETVDNGEDTED